MLSAKKLIEKLDLVKLEPEGGYYRRSCEIVTGSQVITSCIYYLLEAADVSAMHRLDSDEIYHFYLGDPLEIFEIYPDGSSKTTVLGNDLDNGMFLQYKVPKGVWQGSVVLDTKYGFSLIGTTMSPEFTYKGFEIADNSLINKYPQYEVAIKKRFHKL